MESLKLLPCRTGLLLLVLAMAYFGDHGAAADSLFQSYCSNENTGSDSTPLYSIYMSNGLCYDTCVSSYAFAVVQYQDCWCSNYIPANQTDTSSCSEACPGYPDESCGNADTGLFGYVTLTLSASGTSGAAAASSTSSTKQSTFSANPSSTTEALSTPSGMSTSRVSSRASLSSTPSVLSTPSTSSTPSLSSAESPATVYQTQTVSQSLPAIVSYVTPTVASTSTTSTTASTTSTTTSTTSTTSTSSDSSTTSTTTSTSTLSSTSASSSTSTPTSSVIAVTTSSSSIASSTSTTASSIMVSTRVVTVSGAMVTQTVTSTPVPNVTPEGLEEKSSHHSISGGDIAGIVIGALAGLLLLLLAALLFWRRRRARAADAEKPSKGMERNASVLSKAGLLASPHLNDGEKPFDNLAYPAAAMATQRSSTLYGNPADHDRPTSPLAGGYDPDQPDSRRHSRPLVYDQRLNPAALMQNWDHNGSRTSVGTMQDQHDYSRPLNVTNPDIPPPE